MNRQPKGRHVKSIDSISASVAASAADATNSIAGSASSGQSWTSSSTVIPASGGGHLNSSHAQHETRYLEVIARVRGNRGPAVAELARFLGKTGMLRSAVDCAELAVQLLAVESEEACEAIRVLVEDGWEGDLGELLACARKA